MQALYIRGVLSAGLLLSLLCLDAVIAQQGDPDGAAAVERVFRINYNSDEMGYNQALAYARNKIRQQVLEEVCGTLVTSISSAEYGKLTQTEIQSWIEGIVRIEIKGDPRKGWRPAEGYIEVTAKVWPDCEHFHETIVEKRGTTRSEIVYGNIEFLASKPGVLYINDMLQKPYKQGQRTEFCYPVGEIRLRFVPADGSPTFEHAIVLQEGQNERIDLTRMYHTEALLTQSSDEFVFFPRPIAAMIGAYDDDSLAHPDEKPPAKVNLAPYAISRREVTCLEYKLFLDSNAYDKSLTEPYDVNHPAYSWKGGRFKKGRERRPVSLVTWEEARRYCRWCGGDLPTEAEWEYAAKGDETAPYFWGTNGRDASRYAWFRDNSGDTSHQVGQGLNPTGLGIYDIAGNVREWCLDTAPPNAVLFKKDSVIQAQPETKGFWNATKSLLKSVSQVPQKITDYLHRDKNTVRFHYRSARGGSFLSPVTELRSSNRVWRADTGRYPDVGLRCVFHRGDFYRKALMQEDPARRRLYLLHETRLDPESGPAFFQLGCIDIEQKRFATALANLQRARTNWKAGDDYSQSDALRLCADVLTEADNREKNYSAKTYYDEAIATESNPRKRALSYQKRGMLMEREGRPEAALNDYHAAITLDSSLVAALILRANLHRKEHSYDSALADFDKVLRIDRFNAEAYTGRAHVRYSLNNVEDALADLAYALDLDSTNIQALELRSRIYIDRGMYKEAQVFIEKCIHFDPSYAPCRFLSALAYEHQGFHEAAIDHIEQCVKLDSSYTDSLPLFKTAYLAVGKKTIAAGNYSEAAAILEKAHGADRSDADIRRALAEACFLKAVAVFDDDRPKADSLTDRAVDLAAEYSSQAALLYLSKALEQVDRGADQAVLDLFFRACTFSSDIVNQKDSVIAAVLFRSALTNRDIKPYVAIDRVSMALSKWPDHDHARYLRMQLLERVGETTAAQSDIDYLAAKYGPALATCCPEEHWIEENEIKDQCHIGFETTIRRTAYRIGNGNLSAAEEDILSLRANATRCAADSSLWRRIDTLATALDSLRREQLQQERAIRLHRIADFFKRFVVFRDPTAFTMNAAAGIIAGKPQGFTGTDDVVRNEMQPMVYGSLGFRLHRSGLHQLIIEPGFLSASATDAIHGKLPHPQFGNYNSVETINYTVTTFLEYRVSNFSAACGGRVVWFNIDTVFTGRRFATSYTNHYTYRQTTKPTFNVDLFRFGYRLPFLNQGATLLYATGYWGIAVRDAPFWEVNLTLRRTWYQMSLGYARPCFSGSNWVRGAVGFGVPALR